MTTVIDIVLVCDIHMYHQCSEVSDCLLIGPDFFMLEYGLPIIDGSPHRNLEGLVLIANYFAQGCMYVLVCMRYSMVKREGYMV